ncbi:MAG TPA: HNH endonuclease [Clostridia bacterium]
MRIAWNKGIPNLRIKGENNPNWKGGDVTKICLQCGIRFKRALNRKGRTAKFCSPACVHKHRDFGLTSQHERIRKSKDYILWRTAVFIRDEYTCQSCGVKNKNGLGKTIVLQVDHIKPFSLYPELRLAIDNGRTLCEGCHKKTDTFGVKAWRKDCVATA